MQKLNKTSGFSLVSVLLAAGMMGVIAGGFSNMMINQNKSAKHLENRIDLQAIKRRIIEQLDCKKTLGINSSGGITTCSNDMPIRNTKGDIVGDFSEKHSQGGYQLQSDWYVKVNCDLSSSENSLHISVAKSGDGNTFLKHALTSAPMNFDSNVLFNATDPICRDYFIGVPAEKVCTGDMIVTGIGVDGELICQKVYSGDIEDGEVKLADIAANAVDSSKIVDGSVGELDLASNSVAAVKIKTGAVATAKIAGLAVTEAKLADGAVTSNKIAANAVGSGKIATNAVNSTNIQPNAVIQGKIATNAVVSANLQPGSVIEGKLGSSAVNTTNLKDNAVETNKIAGNAVTSAKIQPGAIITNRIAAGNVTASTIADGNVTTAKIANNNVTTAKIADGNVTTIKIANNNITTAKIADGNVTTVKIADGNVTTAKLADGSVTTSKIANGNVTFAKLDPTGCAVGSVITRSGTGYSCSAPSAMPACGEGQILRVVGGAWNCVNPLTLLPSCAADKVLVKDAGGNWVCGDPWYSNLCICIVGRGHSDTPGGNQCRPINQWAEAWNSGDLRRISIMVKPAPCTNPPAKVHDDDDD